MSAKGWQSWPAAALRRMTHLFLPASLRQPDAEEKALLRAHAFIRVTLLILGGLLVIFAIWAVNVGPFNPVSLAWAAYAAVLTGNLVLVRLTGQFHSVTVANNMAGLVLIATLLHFTDGLYSALMPLFLIGFATTGNFGGNRAILTFFSGFVLVVVGTYLWQLHEGGHGDDIHGRFAFLLTALVMAVLANLSAQWARTNTRRLLKNAHDAAVADQRKAREAKEAAEKALDSLRSAQTQMVMQEKMASLGALVAGVAHEVNTPVGLSVTGASQLRQETARILDQTADGTLRRTTFDEYLALVNDLSTLIEKNATRAAALIQSFKEVAVDQSSDARRPFKLGPYIAEIVTSLAPRTRRAGHRIELSIPEDITIDGYPGAMAQVVTNLVINSIMHGYPEPRPGTFRLSAHLLADDRIELVYSDDGQGIAPELRPRIFEPFFTTKRGMGGSGLGLHLLYNIVTARMGGTVQVDTTPGGGARFTLIFPRISPQPALPVEVDSPAVVDTSQ